MLTSVGTAVTVLSLLLEPAVAQEPPECVVLNSYGRCVVSAVDPGRPGSPAPDEPERRRPRAQEPDDEVAAPPPPPRPSVVSLPTGDGGWVQTPQAEIDALLAGLPANGAPAAADPQATAEVLAARALELLTLQPPVPRMSTSGMGFVGLPTWLWIDGGDEATGPVSATATAGAAQVTATGRLSAVEWEMGPPGELVRCAGPGTPWTGQDGPSPDCGYAYEQRSLPERTGGAGAWTVTATAVWTVTWSGVSGGVPVEGVQTVLVPASTTLPVGEVQVLVGGGDR